MNLLHYRSAVYHGGVPRTDMYFKIMIEHDKDERMEKLASEIQRQIAKVYGVRLVEMTNYVTRPPES